MPLFIGESFRARTQSDQAATAARIQARQAQRAAQATHLGKDGETTATQQGTDGHAAHDAELAEALAKLVQGQARPQAAAMQQAETLRAQQAQQANAAAHGEACGQAEALQPLHLPLPQSPPIDAAGARKFLQRQALVNPDVATLLAGAAPAPAPAPAAQQLNLAPTPAEGPGSAWMAALLPPGLLTRAQLNRFKQQHQLTPRAGAALGQLLGLGDAPAAKPEPGGAGAARAARAGGPANARLQPMSWTAFANLLSRAQLAALLKLALWRHRELSAQQRNETAAMQLDAQRTQQAIYSQQSVLQTQLISQGLSVYAEWLQLRAGVLQNSGKALQRLERGMQRDDGHEAAQLMAKMQALVAEQSAAQAARRATDPVATRGLPAPGEVMNWVPHAAGPEGRFVPRLVLSNQELAGFTAQARQRYTELAQALGHAEEVDLSSKYGRLSLSATQLQQASEQTTAAANAGQASADAALTARLRGLAGRYAAAASEQRTAARRCGYLQAVVTANRSTKPTLAHNILAEAQQRQLLGQRATALREQLTRSQLEASQRHALQQTLAQTLQAADSCAIRIAGMRGAASATDAWEHTDSLRRHASGTEAVVQRANAVQQRLQQAAQTPNDAALQQTAQQHLRDFSATLPNEVVGASLLSASLHQAAAQAPQAAATLARNDASAEARAVACSQLQAALLRQAGALDLCGQIPKARMAQHVQERRQWDAQQTGLTAQAEAHFWQYHPTLPEKGATPDRAWRLAATAHDPLAPQGPPGAARHGAQSAQDPAFSAIARFAEPTHVDLLDAAALQAYLQAHSEDGVAWARSYHDPAYERLQGVAARVRMGGDLLGRISGGMGGIAEGAADDYAATTAETRAELYAAMGREQSATLGLHRQLLSLLRASGS